MLSVHIWILSKMKVIKNGKYCIILVIIMILVSNLFAKVNCLIQDLNPLFLSVFCLMSIAVTDHSSLSSIRSEELLLKELSASLLLSHSINFTDFNSLAFCWQWFIIFLCDGFQFSKMTIYHSVCLSANLQLIIWHNFPTLFCNVHIINKESSL